jgi:hypothetical protein
MHRIRSLLAALAALAITAGIVAAHAMPAASNGGLDTARHASGKQVPLGAGVSAPDANTTNESQDTAEAPPEGTHGADVSAAAKAPTPAGDWANHGAYVSSIAKGWGQTTSAAHRNVNATSHTPTAAAKGLAHRP